MLDTNVVASGLMWEGATARLIELAASGPLHVQLVCSTPLLAELRDIIGRRKFSKRLLLKSRSPDEFVADYACRTTLVAPSAIPPTVHEDPDDDVVLATAHAGQAHLLVTGDAHLLRLGRFRFVPIVRPAAAIAMLGGPPLRRRPPALLPKGEAHPHACDGMNTAPALSSR
ncbi:putative toxin-antitoxin system toxin component, PIN family [Roseateles noduli]|uniref:putative toxin-antitoxin system toxin component, PIN family n=1 Tax=Roseateles noduli TaxID=2052484 RepID=UPI003D646F5A